MSRFHYVKCLGDNSWLAKPANAGVFKKDVREAAPLTIKEAGRHGFKVDDPVYKLIPVEDVYQSDVATVTVSPGVPANEARAYRGRILVALSFLLSKREAGWLALQEWANEIDLSQEPEIPMSELLTDLMHYCHKDKIEFYGTDGAMGLAMRQFNAESGGAAI